MKYSTSSRKLSSQKWTSIGCCSCINSLSLYLAFIVLLLGMGSISKSAILASGESVAASSATSATSGEANSPVECTPLGEMIASRFNRATPESSLRMLRAGGHRRAIESLIKTHNNCMLMTDRVRFKKSSSGALKNNNALWSTYKVRGATAAVVVPAVPHRIGENYNLETMSPMNFDRLKALFLKPLGASGSRFTSSSSPSVFLPQSSSSAILDSGLYSVKLPASAILRSGYTSSLADSIKPLMLLAPASEVADAEDAAEK